MLRSGKGRSIATPTRPMSAMFTVASAKDRLRFRKHDSVRHEAERSRLEFLGCAIPTSGRRPSHLGSCLFGGMAYSAVRHGTTDTGAHSKNSTPSPGYMSGWSNLTTLFAVATVADGPAISFRSVLQPYPRSSGRPLEGSSPTLQHPPEVPLILMSLLRSSASGSSVCLRQSVQLSEPSLSSLLLGEH